MRSSIKSEMDAIWDEREREFLRSVGFRLVRTERDSHEK